MFHIQKMDFGGNCHFKVSRTPLASECFSQNNLADIALPWKQHLILL